MIVCSVCQNKTKKKISAKGTIIEEEISGNTSIEGMSAHHRVFPGLLLSILLSQESLAQFWPASVPCYCLGTCLGVSTA